MPSEKALAALRAHAFKPGQSGNPKGRAKRRSLIDILKDELAKKDGPEGETNAEYLIHRMVQAAIHGDFRYAQLVMEYAVGKPEPPVRIVEDQIIAIAAAEGIEPRVLIARTRAYAERLA